MPSAAIYNMRTLLIIVLIWAAFADEAVHYPTNHTGVCNILAFVRDHVDEVIHVAHDETEDVTDKSLENPIALVKEIQKVKRQVKDIMQVAQCSVTDLEKTDIVKNPQAVDLLETYSTHKPQLESVSKLLEKTENVKKIATQLAEQPQQTPQHVAGTLDDKRPVIDVVDLLQTTSPKPLEPKLDDKVRQKDTVTISQSLAAEFEQQSSQHVASNENKLRQVRDVVHLLESFLETADATQQIDVQKSAGNEGHFPPIFVQNVATKERHRRNVIKSIGAKIPEVSEFVNTKTADIVQHNLKSDYIQRTTRDVAHLLPLQPLQPSQLENEVKVENHWQNSKSDYFQAVDILPEETEYVEVQEPISYADQLFPPTIGQHANFHEKLKRDVVNVVEEGDNIPHKDSHAVAPAPGTARLVRDVVHLVEAFTTVAPQEEHLKSTTHQPANFVTIATQNVAKQLGNENDEHHILPNTEQSSATKIEILKEDSTLQIIKIANENVSALQVPQTTNEVNQYVLQHVALPENESNGGKTKASQNRRKRNVEIGRKIPPTSKKQQNNILKKKTKRSPNELLTSQLQQNLDNKSKTLKESQEKKYIQIIKPQAFGKRTRRSEEGTLNDRSKSLSKSYDFIQDNKDSHDLPKVKQSEIESTSRVIRSSLESITKPKEFQAQHTKDDENSQHVAIGGDLNKRLVRSSDDSLIVPPSPSAQNTIDSQEDVEELLKPTVKVQHPSLPLTQFAQRNTTKTTI